MKFHYDSLGTVKFYGVAYTSISELNKSPIPETIKYNRILAIIKYEV